MYMSIIPAFEEVTAPKDLVHWMEERVDGARPGINSIGTQS